MFYIEAKDSIFSDIWTEVVTHFYMKYSRVENNLLFTNFSLSLSNISTAVKRVFSQ